MKKNYWYRSNMTFKLLVFIGCLSVVVGGELTTEHDLITQLEENLIEGKSLKTFTKRFNETLAQIQLPYFFTREEKGEIGYEPLEVSDDIVCSLCYVVANFLIDEVRANVSLDVIALEAEAFCTLLGIETARVCTGVIELNLPIFAYLVYTNPELKGQRICDVILQSNGCSSTVFEWSVDVPEGSTVQRKSPSDPEQTFNILHISDLHFDPLYTEGKTKSCSEPLCCQSDQADGAVEQGTACGYWSEYYHADTSEALVDETFRKASEMASFDYVYFTGDIVSHRVWSTSVESNTALMKTVFQKLKESFKGVPIYPILGNHEPTPVNEYAIGEVVDPAVSTEWLYKLIASEFSEWLPDSAQNDLLKGGYYSVSPREGFRIVGLNGNVAQTMNWWLIQNDTDPMGQLAWLVETLKEAEENNEVVHILTHIPTGKSDLMAVWSREYHKIIQRFANTIGAQFNGHTHKDQFVVYYNSSNSSEAISVAINGASVVTDKSNPSFKILSVDSNSFDLIDQKAWTFNLTKANEVRNGSDPEWYQIYSFREAFDVQNLAPSAFSELLPRMAKNHTLLEMYHLFKYRNSDVVINTQCNDDCKKDYLCEVTTSKVGDSTQCDILKELYDKNVQ
ncbi:sphingomyelin phosphodiesterase-like [Anthonomus grandis grandis]|uniref:sphingomyelin phosphodiesterase-like n=1 Tax=Anthonomus grandis grandis TaxID=2921223 RepID=UPI002165582F|nr:sphingomyelin phosphodiesterase-like [Anthonomus grandis grandis]